MLSTTHHQQHNGKTGHPSLLHNRPFLLYLVELGEWGRERASTSEEENPLHQLYEFPAVVSAVFRILPPLSQHCFLHLMYQQDALRYSVKRRFEQAVFQAVDLLRQLCIVEGDMGMNSRANGWGLQINEEFRMNHIASLLSSPLQLSKFTRQAEIDEKLRKTVEKEMAKKSLERWESVLSYLALPSDSATASSSSPSKDVTKTTRQLFLHIGFTTDGGKAISSKGFQFLLLSRVEQMWSYLIHYLRMLAAKKEKGGEGGGGLDAIIAVVKFLMELLLCVPSSMLQPGAQPVVENIAFTIDSKWSKEVLEFIQHLRKVGILYMRKKEDSFFLVSPLLVELAESAGNTSVLLQSSTQLLAPISQQSGKGGFLVTETNFRVYAYTDSRLHLAILSSFTEFLYHLPNVVVAVITRDAVRRALQTGITSQQITLYLRSNAHPHAAHTRGQAQCIPHNVVEQIELWELERQRIAYQSCSLYSAFDSEEEYTSMKEYATEQGFLLWHDDTQRLLAISDKGEQQVREWWASMWRSE